MEMRDLRAQYIRYKKEIDSAVNKVLENANFIGGEEVNTLEKSLAEYVGVKHCISCANGTEAMSLVLMAWDIKEGDAVFVPDFTFFSTGEVVSFRNAVPIFVDVDKETFNMDADKLEAAILCTLREGRLMPKAVIPVDMFGLPAAHTEISRIAKKYNLLVLEDGAQGFGGSINGKKACGFGDAATTSFFPAKPLGCYGDGGAIFTNDDFLAQIINSLKVHGKGSNKYDNVRIGANSRLDTIQAAVLNVKLMAFKEYELDAVNRIYRIYNERLRNIVSTPVIPSGYESSFAQYTIKLESMEERILLQAKLKENSIPSAIYYIKPMHKQQAFSHLISKDVDYAVANELCDIVLSLPMHPYITEEDAEKITGTIAYSLTGRHRV
ncbi:dTDP-4-amino-4,6-dideoxygalactose transaminase [Ruminiclostridium sufflavum DSM 19573]|uniref:dTDP-4-amino-4,6-dideoxygalactose transaminase n=1 Tax=Ruminiclostridium sufflavum DSM 19573 TaxID=1121337 RepID=A0A318XJH2_9FIRM|nr:DegT/DnrJ/EryC1/StrS family aminotransferase [Ruminiclostridium sufflavum]PYG84989.1 dTDP-4-amino-4,6-dideoxygalactose transaminase [Ruminiclostridium sufflavum DSM 19573]